MVDKTESRREFIINMVYFLMIAVIVYFVLKYLFGLFFPFFLGFIISLILMPIVRKVNKWFNSKGNKLIAAIILILFYVAIGGLLTIVVLKIISLLEGVFTDLPNIFNHNIKPLLDSSTIYFGELFNNLDPEIIAMINNAQTEIVDTISSIVKGISSGALNFLTNSIKSVPSMLISFLFTIISSFFIIADYERIVYFFKYQLSERANEVVGITKKIFSGTILSFLKAYGILMSLTFVQLSIGLTVLKVDNAIGVAILIAMIDILPVLGTGTVMIPWVIIELFNKNMRMAIGLGFIYLFITIVRNIIEPKVVGTQLGLNPLLTLMSMYIGGRLFGFFGLFGFPILLTMVISLQEQGVIKLYNDPSNKQNKLIESSDINA